MKKKKKEREEKLANKVIVRCTECRLEAKVTLRRKLKL